jgi:hypothetical protein
VDPEAIEILADAYLQSNHDISSVLRVLFNSDFFKQSRFARVKCPAEFVVGALRLSGAISEPTLEINEARAVIGYMGQFLLNPPSVEGWHEGQEWINSGALVERVNFAAKQLSNIDNPGVKSIISELSRQTGEYSTPEFIVDRCLDLMGPLTMTEDDTKSALVEHVANGGDLNLQDLETDGNSLQRIGDLLGLIASTKEFNRT